MHFHEQKWKSWNRNRIEFKFYFFSWQCDSYRFLYHNCKRKSEPPLYFYTKHKQKQGWCSATRVESTDKGVTAERLLRIITQTKLDLWKFQIRGFSSVDLYCCSRSEIQDHIFGTQINFNSIWIWIIHTLLSECNELCNTEFSEKHGIFTLGRDLRTHNCAIAEVQSFFSSCDNS